MCPVVFVLDVQFIDVKPKKVSGKTAKFSGKLRVLIDFSF